jgi:acyl carrier protein
MTRTDLLARLSQLAVQRFGERAHKLGPTDDMFDVLAIDSLQALDLLSDLERAFDLEIPDYEMVGVKTLEGLADVIEARS